MEKDLGGVLGDQEARRRAEEALEAERERLRITLASIGDGVVSTDAQGRVTYLNPVAEALTGWTIAEAAGRPLVEVFRIVNEHTRAEVENPALRALREGVVVGLANHTILIARDGAERPIDDSAAPMFDARGEAIGSVLVFRDVTDRIRAREAATRLAAIVESSDDAIVSKGLDGVIRSWNAGAERLFGWTAEEAVGRVLADLIIPPDRLGEEVDILTKLGRGERVEPFETVRLRKDGREVEISATMSPMLDDEGRVVAASKIARDISAAKEAERALADSRSRLDYAARLSGIGFWYCDLPFDELIWDVRVKEHFWLGPDERVTIDTFYERIHPDDREPTRRAIEASVDGRKPYDIDYRTVDPATGEIKWIHAVGGTSFAADGTPTRFDGVTLDVTGRRLDQRRLARLLDRERELSRMLRRVEQAGLAIHAAGSLDGVLRAIAEEAREIVGAHQSVASLTIGEGWGQSISTVSLSDRYARWREFDVEPTGEGIYVEVIKANRPMRMTQAELEAHPAWRNFSGHAQEHPPMRGWLAVPLVARDGRSLGLLQLSDKFEGEFTAEDEAVAVQLARIASVAVENARLYDELSEQDRRKSEFLAMLAHELRNPLAPLRNGLQLMRLSPDAETTARSRDMMERQLGHMVRLIDDLMDVSRINQGKMELRRDWTTLGEVVASAVETARPLIEQAGHELAVSLPTAPAPLNADLTRLAQVVSNLLTNSAKYTPRGGRIRLSGRVERGMVVLRVEDNGIGIPATELPRLFDMFSQVDRSLARSNGGLGIGLALVKGLVELHGGTVEAESGGPGRGSAFTVRLPAEAGPPPAREPARAEPPAGSVARLRILVADDNRDSAATMSELLRILGAEVRTAYDGLEAVEASEAFRPDAILMDVGMPRLDGREATRRIRQFPWGREVVIIALTGWGQESDRALTREAGCDGHLVKPVDLPELEKLLSELGRPR
ncbi:PAS domain S-box protein [Paludisphaera sp.]|uniref:hybrid sensor histidine kinase/response regulator n=1 Tax=Paludisphaera sp. TaxID=2017432 RepID=UPI00301D2679